MANEYGDDINPNKDVQDDVVVDDNDDVDALKEKFDKISEQNKQLFARAKKAEGFIQNDNGEWVKAERSDSKPKSDDEPKEPSKKHSQSSELDYGQLAFHNTKQGATRIEDPDDVDFLKQTLAETGKSQDAILNSKWFASELKERQAARASSNAVPKSKSRSGQPVSSNLDEAMAVYKETGKMPNDFELRNKLVDRLTDKENTSMFNGPSVGPAS